MRWRFRQEKGNGLRVPEMVSSLLLDDRYDWSVVRYTDRVVKLWDLHQEDVAAPSCSFSGPSVSL
jgi:hypothetical protein